MPGRTLFGRPVGSRTTGVAAIGVVALVAVVTATLVVGGRPPGASPSGSPATQASASPSTSAEPAWAAVDLVDVPRVATFAAVAVDAGGVRPDSAFTLTSRSGEPAAALAARLESTPEVAFTVLERADDGLTATLAPVDPLDPGQPYRVVLRTEDGAVAGSWAFVTRGPVAVIATVPGNATTRVPVDTGIEVTFNQDGVEDIASRWSIVPATPGRFERHGRTQVFVPDAPLAFRTLYTVTVGAGLSRTGTDLALAEDVVVRFETAAQGETEPEPRFGFGRDVIEAAPGEAPMAVLVSLGLDDYENPAAMPLEADLTAYRFASAEDASAALATFLRAPRWTAFTDPLIPTEGLPVAVRFQAKLEQLTGAGYLARFPDPLPVGWYVVEIAAARPAHAFLQVTPVSAWVAVLRDRTVAWVNDVTTGKPVRAATVALEGAKPFATSDADGVAVGPTPAALIPAGVSDAAAPPPSPILRVTAPSGRVVLVPFDVAGAPDTYRGEWWEKQAPADERFWSVLATDRATYRSDDTIRAWGYLRARDDGAVPASVGLRLVAYNDEGSGTPAAAKAAATPNPDGAFTASLTLRGVPVGSYEVQSLVDGRVVGSQWVTVEIIRKPAYRLTLTTNRRAVITGTPVEWTVAATFFDGSSAQALDVEVEGSEGSTSQLRTGADGRARVAVPAVLDPEWELEDASDYTLQARPMGPEAAEIWADASVLVFPSALVLDGDGSLTDRRLRVSGALHAVDLARVERELAAGTWEGDAAGAAVPSARITVTVTEQIPVRRQVGTTYDFVEKRVVPVYEYETEERPLPAMMVTSRRDGTFSVDLTVPSAKHSYEIVLRTEDGEGRVQLRSFYTGPGAEEGLGEPEGTWFATPTDADGSERTYAIGDRLAWPMVDRGRTLRESDGGRYLYIVTQRGLRDVAVTTDPVFRHTFAAADAPRLFVMGVRFTGTTYAPKADAWATFREETRRLTVDVRADKARYRPGEPLTLAVRTTRRDGTPVAATVVLQAVDEKLYAMGAAETVDPLWALYGGVDSGVVRLTSTHQAPTDAGGEGEGDTGGSGGDGPRDDFRDTLLFGEVRTDADGRGALTVTLSDDLTSWHVAAMAMTAGLEAGVKEALVPVGLPFFVEATVADTYLVSDRPAIRLRAYGDALRAGDVVEFTVQSASLGMPATRVTGTAFAPVTITLPALAVGDHALDVSGRATTRTGADGKALADRLAVPFTVIRSRLTAAEAAWLLAGEPLPAVPADAGLASYTFTDAGRGRYLPLLESLVGTESGRVERALAGAVARDLLVEAFDRDPATVPGGSFDRSRWSLLIEEDDDGMPVRAGLTPVPWAGADPWTAVHAALFAPEAFAGSDMIEVLEVIRDAPTTGRDLQVAAVAALAAMGEPALGDLRMLAAAPDLVPWERVYLALGFAAAGDVDRALALERELLAASGERLGGQVRLRMPSATETRQATARLAVVAATVGDPLAGDLAAFVEVNPAADSTEDLELAAYAARMIERTPAGATAFAYTVGGERTEVRLEPAESRTLLLTAVQRATLRVEAVAGKVGIAVAWRAVVPASSLEASPDLGLRRIAPATVGVDRVVVVTLRPDLGDEVLGGCYEVVEQVPSGLAPLTSDWGVNEQGAMGPWSVSGQEVRWCVARDPVLGVPTLEYRARVVSAGTYTWEPAVMQHESAPELLAKTPASSVTITNP